MLLTKEIPFKEMASLNTLSKIIPINDRKEHIRSYVRNCY